MAYTDPLSITIAASTISLPRTNAVGNKSEYTSADGLIKLSAAHTYGRRTRRVLRLDHSKIAPDSYTAVNAKFSMSNYIVFDVPPTGYTNAQQLEVYAGFKAAFTATSDVLITKLLGGES